MTFKGSKACRYCGKTWCYGTCVNQTAKPGPEAPRPEPAPPNPPPPLPKGELIGYRCWNLDAVRADAEPMEIVRDDGHDEIVFPYTIVLRSMNGTPWPGPVMHADQRPTKWNHSGIYVLRSPDKRYDESAPVSGSIALYGKVVEHKDGYRAEHAMIRTLTLHISNITEHLTPGTTIAKQIATLAQMLEHRYECEVLIDSTERDLHPLDRLMRKIAAGTITSADLEALAKEFGA